MCCSCGQWPWPTKATEFSKVVQIAHIATINLPDKESRVVFAAEASLGTLYLKRWVATVEKYPENYKTSDAIFTAPPCTEPQMVKEVCSIQEITGEPLFRGSFEMTPYFTRFAGSTTDTAGKILHFRDQLRAHPDWTMVEVDTALASIGAKFGPDKKKEFMATLPLKGLRDAFGPIKLKNVTSVPTVPNSSWPAYWKVQATLLNDPKKQLVMYFEPFEGRLQQLSVAGPIKVWDRKTRKFKWEDMQR
jgi:hypothetical protein